MINVVLLMQLPQDAWIRYGVWLLLGKSTSCQPSSRLFARAVDLWTGVPWNSGSV